MALLLGMFGIYGVISYAVAQRRREIGIRMALGAQGRQILALFIRRGLIVTGAGVALGLAGAFAFTRLMRALCSASAPRPSGFCRCHDAARDGGIHRDIPAGTRGNLVNPVETMRAE